MHDQLPGDFEADALTTPGDTGYPSIQKWLGDDRHARLPSARHGNFLIQVKLFRRGPQARRSPSVGFRLRSHVGIPSEILSRPIIERSGSARVGLRSLVRN